MSLEMKFLIQECFLTQLKCLRLDVATCINLKQKKLIPRRNIKIALDKDCNLQEVRLIPDLYL